MRSSNDKMSIVVALPFRPNIPLDPHWYTEEFVDYIIELLPSNLYDVKSFFVSLVNISQFFAEVEEIYSSNKNVCILNFCDGGEWDGYPGISVVRKWEQCPLSKIIPMSGGTAQFILNSDDKSIMNAYMRQANLNFLPQIVIQYELLNAIEGHELNNRLIDADLDKAWPLFCKLNIGAGALSIGPDSVCHDINELLKQLNKIHVEFPNSNVLIQPFLPGPEYTILILKDQIYAAVKRDFHNPYNLMLENYLTGLCDVNEEITFSSVPKHVQDLALKAIEAIPGKHHYTRVDMRNDANGITYIIDINDRPGFGDPSTIKCMLDHHRLTESQFLQDIIKTCSCIHTESEITTRI